MNSFRLIGMYRTLSGRLKDGLRSAKIKINLWIQSARNKIVFGQGRQSAKINQYDAYFLQFIKGVFYGRSQPLKLQVNLQMAILLFAKIPPGSLAFYYLPEVVALVVELIERVFRVGFDRSVCRS